MSFTWDDENKAKAVADYVAANATPDNSMEIVKEQAEALGCTANGLRTILSQAKVYVKKTPAGKSGSGGGSDSKTTRVSKADALKSLHVAIESLGLEPDDEITGKLTGKAALYFAEVIKSAQPAEDEE